MGPRTILYSGKGGVGKTSVAAATARRCAAAGARTIVLSTDPAHSLADALEAEVGGEPTDVGGGLFAQQVQAQDELEPASGYFGAWHGLQREQLAFVESGFAPVPVLRAPYFAHEVVGPERLDALADAVFGARDAAAVLHDRLAQELRVDGRRAELRLDLPFVDKGDVALKKIGLELVVRVDGHQRTIVLPGALAGYRPTSARLAEGALVVGFDGG